MSPTFKASTRPKLACEVAADRVLAGRLADTGEIVEVCSAHELSPGLVVPDLIENNLREPDTVAQIIRDAMGSNALREAKGIIALGGTAYLHFGRVGVLAAAAVPPKDPGRAKFLNWPQYDAAADLANSEPHSRRAADCASTKLGVFSPSPARWTSAQAIANTGTL